MTDDDCYDLSYNPVWQFSVKHTTSIFSVKVCSLKISCNRCQV